MRHSSGWNVTTGREVEYSTDLLSFHDADAEFAVDLAWSPAEYEECWGAIMQVRPAGYSVEGVTLINICIGGKSRSREYLSDLIGENEVREIEDWHADDIDPNELAE